MADKITKSIRRIVKGMRDDPTGLGNAEELKSIGTTRGEAYINSRGDVTGSGSEGGEDIDDQPGSATPPTDDPSDNDTGGGGGINKGSTDTEDLNGDVAEVHDEASSGDTVGTVSGTSTDGQTIITLVPTPIEGIEYIPPDGWDDPETPPDAEEGFSWAGSSATEPNYYESTAGLANGYETYDPFVLSVDSTSVIDEVGIVSSWFGTKNYTKRVTYQVTLIGDTQTTRGGHFITTPVGEENIETDAPSDDVCAMVYDHSAGGYKGSTRDPDCSEAEKTPSECTIIRSAKDPSRYFRYCRLSNGGTKITEVDSGGAPLPGSVTKTTDPDGNVNGFYDSSLDASIK